MRIRRAAIWLLLSAALAGGCGLGDYERRIDQQRARLRIFDEENKYLGGMPDVPVGKDGSKMIPFDIFLRLPLGIANRVPDKDGSFLAGDLMVYRYPGAEGYAVYLAGALVGTRDKKDLKPGEMPPDEFRTYFLDGVRSFLTGKNVPRAGKPERVTKTPTSYTGETLPPLELDYFAMEGDTTKANAPALYVGAYILQKGSRLVGVAYEIPLAKKSNPAIDMSLKTLDIGDSAATKRSAFARNKRLD